MQTFSIDGKAVQADETDRITIHSTDRRRGPISPFYVASITWGSVTFTGRIGVNANSTCYIHVPYISEIGSVIDWADIQSDHSGDVMFAPVSSIRGGRALQILHKAAAAWYWQQEQSLAEQRAQYSAMQHAAITGGAA